MVFCFSILLFLLPSAMTAIKSTFRPWIYWIIGLLVLALVFLVWLLSILIDTGEVLFLIPIMMFAFIPVWLLYGEFRTRAISVSIEGDAIIVTNYLGLGLRKAYNLAEFDGFNTVMLPSRRNEYEYLFLMKKGKRLITISEFYHSNYAELKLSIQQKVRNCGRIECNLAEEFKDLFR